MLVLGLAAISSVQAQRQMGVVQPVKQLRRSLPFSTNGIEGAACDTIIPFPDTSTLVAYFIGRGQGGYISGTNSTNDKQKLIILIFH